MASKLNASKDRYNNDDDDGGLNSLSIYL